MIDELIALAERVESPTSRQHVIEEYDAMINELRTLEFPQLKGETFLDHAGSTLASKSQLEAHMRDIQTTLYANPHSQSPSSIQTTEAIELIRERVLAYFSTSSDTHSIVFTSGATGAMQTLAHTFPWASSSIGSDGPQSHSHKHTHKHARQHVNIRSCTRGSMSEYANVTASNGNETLSVSESGSVSVDTGACACANTSEFVDGNGDECPDIFCKLKHTPHVEGAQEEFHSCFAYLESNHTSVVGIRGVAEKEGADVLCLTESDVESLLDKHEVSDRSECKCSPNVNGHTSTSINTNTHIRTRKPIRHCLFAYPAQCNFSGKRYPLKWINGIQGGALNPLLYAQTRTQTRHTTCTHGYELSGCDDGGAAWHVLLDAAAYATSAPLNLTTVNADFVAVSFYKLFGYPTGLGALIVRNDALLSPTNSVCKHTPSYTPSHVDPNALDEADSHPYQCACIHGDTQTTQQHSTLGWLNKRYYGGGTLTLSDNKSGVRAFAKDIHTALEDGTISYLSILALGNGLDAIDNVGGIERIATHTHALASWLYHQLSNLRHEYTHMPVCKLYTNLGDWQDCASSNKISLVQPTTVTNEYTQSHRRISRQGPVIALNILHKDGSLVGYSQVAQLAALERIHIRTGCLCNSGACHNALNLTLEDVMSNYDAGHVCGDGNDMVRGRPTGVVRVSLGYMSNMNDMRTFLGFIYKYFASAGTRESESVGVDKRESACIGEEVKGHGSVKMPQQLQAPYKATDVEICAQAANTETGVITHVYVYPIKSCGAFEVPAIRPWRLYTHGLAYDRQWMIVDDLTNRPLTMKKYPRMCLIRPKIMLDLGLLRLNATGMKPLDIALKGYEASGVTPESKSIFTPINAKANDHTHTTPLVPPTTIVRVCNRRVQGVKASDASVNEWLSRFLNVKCSLIKCASERVSRDDHGKRINGYGLKTDEIANTNTIPNVTSTPVPTTRPTTTSTTSTSTYTTSDGSIEFNTKNTGNDGKNESPFLIVNEDSVREIDRMVHGEEAVNRYNIIGALHFRPNFVVRMTEGVEVRASASGQFAEDNWTELCLPGRGYTTFVVQKPCVRCQMICVNPYTGGKSKQPLQALGQCRRKKLSFGMYLALKQQRLANHQEIQTPAQPLASSHVKSSESSPPQGTITSSITKHNHKHTNMYNSTVTDEYSDTHTLIAPGDTVYVTSSTTENEPKKNDSDDI
eukprot:CFRG6294T1